MIPFLKKEHPELPDHYGIKIIYHSGSMEEFNIASHRFLHETEQLEFVTDDDKWNLVPISSYRRIEFDKRFSTIVAIKEKKNAKDNSIQ